MSQDVAEFTTTCERYVGTESGGMDQAISMMGMPQIAKLIEFNPVSCHYLCCPLHTNAVVLIPGDLHNILSTQDIMSGLLQLMMHLLLSITCCTCWSTGFVKSGFKGIVASERIEQKLALRQACPEKKCA